MNILFAGSVEGNNGPANVNRELVHHWPAEDQITTITGKNKVQRLLDFVPKLMAADVVITVGGTKLESVATSYMRACHKKTVVISHGYTPYENVINHLQCSQKVIADNRAFLANADVVVAVSREHMHFLERQQPELIGHTTYINNAVNPFSQMAHRQYDGHSALTVAVSGGDRPIKGNEIVAKSVMKLRKQGVDCRLLVFGDIDGHNPEFDKLLDEPWVTNNGQLPHSVFISALQQASVFVMNSVYEPFGLSALDSLNAGCPLLLSLNCGVNDVLSVSDDDVIENIHDSDEIAQKILATAEHPNAKRLYGSIDFTRFNWDVSAKRLRDICSAVAYDEDLRPFTI